MIDELNPEVIEKARQVFVSGVATLEQVALQSPSLFGQVIPYETLKIIARQNPKEWMVEKNARGGDISQEVDSIRTIIFEQIIVSAQEGFFVSLEEGANRDQAESLLLELAREYPTLISDVKNIKPRGVDHNLVNAYMNLLAKSKIDIKIGTSAKTSRELAMEAIQEVLDDRSN